jgi:hypothetical protein
MAKRSLARKSRRDELIAGCFKINESKQTIFKLSSPKAAEFRRRFAMARPFPLRGHAVARRAKEVSGVAGEFRCQSLDRSQISKDL